MDNLITITYHFDSVPDGWYMVDYEGMAYIQTEKDFLIEPEYSSVH
ncbi:unnamed protein product [marine sediment metagenome]|uniref:Uncharacterized protein n=1 Tax=marine sediment metagenome TaxID=412755 RepID=X1RCA8_9ZZZZ